MLVGICTNAQDFDCLLIWITYKLSTKKNLHQNHKEHDHHETKTYFQPQKKDGPFVSDPVLIFIIISEFDDPFEHSPIPLAPHEYSKWLR